MTVQRSQPWGPTRRSRRHAAAAAASIAVLGVALFAVTTPAIAASGRAGRAEATYRARPRNGGPVDTTRPTFSNPAHITNPLFPVSTVTSIVLLGEASGERTRFEITRLPDTKTIDWNGQHIKTVVSQFTAFTNGRIHESALDYFAQADDGSVWYLGEDVANYDNGVVVNHTGTWLAGRDGPAGMIMPADPRVGDVFHSENIPGLVFEEDTVTATGLTVSTPSGPVSGAIRIREVLMDGTREDKVYAPGYGQLTAVDLDASGNETLALAVPTDTHRSRLPAALATIRNRADDLTTIENPPDWDELHSTVQEIQAAWRDYQATGVPDLLNAQQSEAIQSLADHVDAHELAEVHQAAIEVTQATLDLTMRHRPPTEIDLGRVDTWATQLLIDAALSNAPDTRGDVASIEATWTRVRSAVDPQTSKRVDRLIARLRNDADHGDLASAAKTATKIRAHLERNGEHH